MADRNSLTSRYPRLQPDTETASPELIEGGQQTVLEALLRSGRVTAIHDSFRDQLRELLETRRPRPAERERVEQRLDEIIHDRDPDTLGTWVFYPWSGRLVHVLPERDYRELRTSRNRYKIAEEEQRTLANLRIGVVGLSVGSASAITLALEEVGGELRLADFDTLSLSNMNRLRSGIHGVGVNKVVLTAREIFEINPYAKLRLFREGLNERNLDAFLLQGSRLDLLIEECDDLFLKVRLRERARELRLPVLMETSDRGLIDVERFDLEPDRPLLHGLIGDLKAEELRGLSTTDKVPFVLDILGIDSLSERFEASLYEVDRTLRTWPQLASAVTLGGALITDTARRIALGQLSASGRFYIDPEHGISAGAAAHGAVGAAESRAAPAGDAQPPAHPRLVSSHHPRLTRAEVEALIHYGTLAPSGGNSQPWRFVWHGSTLDCLLDTARTRTLLDTGGHAGELALGAAIENILLAASAIGWSSTPLLFPDPARPALVARLELTRSEDPGTPRELLELIPRRTTNRRLSERSPLARSELQRLQEAARHSGAVLKLATAPELLDLLGHILGESDRLRSLNPRAHEDMMSEVRWTIADALSTRDGLDFRTLELSPTDLAALKLSRRRGPLDLLRTWQLGTALTEPAQRSVRAASALGLLTWPELSREAWVLSGRALQRVWLAATRLGLAFQPLTSLPYMVLNPGQDDGFTLKERAHLRELQRRYRDAFDSSAPVDALLFRVARAEPPRVRSLRRPVSDVLSVTSQELV